MKNLFRLFYILGTLGFVLLISLFISVVFAQAPSVEQTTTVELAPRSDTFVASTRRTSSFQSDEALWIGNRNFNGFGDQRTLLKFAVPNNITSTTTVTSATLKLYLAAWRSGDAPLTVRVERVENEWPDNITWDTINTLQIEETGFPPERDVPTIPGWYEWDVKDLLTSWINGSQPSPNLGFILKANLDTNNRFRGFWSQDCKEADCKGNRPQLVINYAIATPTPTFTPTPTPGIQSILLSSEHTGVITPGDFITYTIALTNGAFPLSNIVVTNTIPGQLVLVANSIQSPIGWATAVDKNKTITWMRTSLPISTTVQLSYRAQRHTSTPTSTPTHTPTNTSTSTETTTTVGTIPTGTTTSTPTPTATPTASPTATPSDAPVDSTPSLTQTPLPPTATPTPPLTPEPVAPVIVITKSGPTSVIADANINYTLTITNLSSETLSNLVVVDFVPINAEVVQLGDGRMTLPPLQLVEWRQDSIGPQQSFTKQFTVRRVPGATQIVNDLYFVDVMSGDESILRAVGQEPVVTTVVASTETFRANGVDESVTLQPPLAPIINEGAIIRWQFDADSRFNGTLRSNSLRNPPYKLYFPLIPNESNIAPNE